MEKLFMKDDFNADDAKAYLTKRFELNTTRAKDNLTLRTNKYLSCFNAFIKRHPLFSKWSDLAKDLPEILKTDYNTPSTRQSILSLFKALFVEMGGMTDGEWKSNFGKLNTDLKQEYSKESAEKVLEGMTFSEARKINSDNPVVNLYFKLYGAYAKFPCLRIGDYINASTIDNGTNNFIDIKNKTMLRRISKNQKEELLIKFPTQIITEIKKQKIKGKLFGDLTEAQIVSLVRKEFNEVVCNPRYFRTLYDTDILHTFKAKDIHKVREILKISDHSKEIAFQHYHKTQSALFRLLQLNE